MEMILGCNSWMKSIYIYIFIQGLLAMKNREAWPGFQADQAYQCQLR